MRQIPLALAAILLAPEARADGSMPPMSQNGVRLPSIALTLYLGAGHEGASAPAMRHASDEGRARTFRERLAQAARLGPQWPETHAQATAMGQEPLWPGRWAGV